MIIVPALNQWLGLPAATGESVGWSPVYPMQGFDYASAVLTVDQIYGGTVATDRLVRYETWVSLDGRDYVLGGPSGTANDITDAANPPVVVATAVHGAFIRFKFVYEIFFASATAGALFTLHVSLSKKGF